MIRHDENGIRCALEVKTKKLMDLNDTEEEMVHVLREIFGGIRGYITSQNGSMRGIDWQSIEIFSRKDEVVKGFPQIGIGISFEFKKEV